MTRLSNKLKNYSVAQSYLMHWLPSVSVQTGAGGGGLRVNKNHLGERPSSRLVHLWGRTQESESSQAPGNSGAGRCWSLWATGGTQVPQPFRIRPSPPFQPHVLELCKSRRTLNPTRLLTSPRYYRSPSNKTQLHKYVLLLLIV